MLEAHIYKCTTFFWKAAQVTVNVCNRFVTSPAFELFIKRKFKEKRRFLCFTAYNSRTFRIFAALIKKTRCKTRSSKGGGQKRGNNYEKECKWKDYDVTVPYQTLSGNGQRSYVPNTERQTAKTACKASLHNHVNYTFK